MPTPDKTVATILDAADWNARVAQIRRILTGPQRERREATALAAGIATALLIAGAASLLWSRGSHDFPCQCLSI